MNPGINLPKVNARQALWLIRQAAHEGAGADLAAYVLSVTRDVDLSDIDEEQAALRPESAHWTDDADCAQLAEQIGLRQPEQLTEDAAVRALRRIVDQLIAAPRIQRSLELVARLIGRAQNPDHTGSDRSMSSEAWTENRDWLLRLRGPIL